MTAQYKIGEKIDLHVERQEAHFDRACDAAYRMAMMRFDCDDCGHLNNVQDSCRSTDTVIVEFKSYRHTGSMAGQSHHYHFVAWVQRHEDEE